MSTKTFDTRQNLIADLCNYFGKYLSSNINIAKCVLKNVETGSVKDESKICHRSEKNIVSVSTSLNGI